MPYSAEISRTNPSCIVFLIDRSGSMGDPWGGDGSTRTKAEGLADIVNRLLQNLVIKCARSEGVRDYYHIGVIGYGRDVGPAFAGQLAGRRLVPVSEIANAPARVEQRTRKVEDGAGGLVEQSVKLPIWFDAVAEGGTPMCQALDLARSIVEEWLTQYPGCFPPIVINITDGESTDGDPTSAADSLTGLASADGSVLLFNLHISSQQGSPIEFPDSTDDLPDQFARLLFGMSSSLPSFMRSNLQQEGLSVDEGGRGFVFHGDMVSVIKFLDIGTRPSNLR